MYIIVPLAGPDFIDNNGNIKGEKIYNNHEILYEILNSRPWHDAVPSSNYIFIIYNDSRVVNFADQKIKKWFPGCKIIILNEYTKGAAFTVLASSSFIDTNKQIIIDLADIDYKVEEQNLSKIYDLNKADALAITFNSNNPIYSYLLFNEDDKFLEAKEKEVISDIASAGTYIFGSFKSYYDALCYVAKNKKKYLHNNLYYVCPVFNGIEFNGGSVSCIDAKNIVDIKNI